MLRGYPKMQLIGIVLVLISVGLIVGPVGAVVIIYRDNLSGLVIPPEIQGAMNGDASFVLNDNVNSIDGYGGSSDDPASILNNFVAPTFVGATVDEASNTFSVKVNVTNPLNYDLTLNTFSTEVQTPDGQPLATINIDQPSTIVSGESAIVQVAGTWTQAGENYVLAHQQDPSITISLANIVVDINGIKVERSNPFTVTIPISLSGVSFTGQ